MAEQLHRRFTDEQVKALLKRYMDKEIHVHYTLEILGIKRRRFFELVKKYREVITNYVGELIQHDSSYHKWSPYAESKWHLITSLDNHSRMLLYADFVDRETTGLDHIATLKDVMVVYGVPLSYYLENLKYDTLMNQLRIYFAYGLKGQSMPVAKSPLITWH